MTRDVADKPHSSVPLSNPLRTLLHLSFQPFPLSPLALRRCHPVPPLPSIAPRRLTKMAPATGATCA